MPLYEYRCRRCQSLTEAYWPSVNSAARAVRCEQCGSHATTKIISNVSFKIAQGAMYNDEFLHRAKPFLGKQKETAEMFAEAKGSEDAKTFQMAERIGKRIDRALARRVPR